MVEQQQAPKPLGVTDQDGLPPLRVVTIVENPRSTNKPIDASNLPYLHRNPAI